MADNVSASYNITYVVTSGSGVIGVSNKPIYLQGVYVGNASAQAVAFYSGSAVAATPATMCMATLAKGYSQFPLASPNGIFYQTLSNPGDADLRLTFFWLPGGGT